MASEDGFDSVDAPTPGQSTRFEKPAIGAVATTDNADQIVRFVLRGTQFGHGVLIACGPESETDAVRFASRLGADIVPVEGGGGGNSRARLADAASSLGYPGLVFCDRLDEWVDYSATLVHFEEREGTFTVAPVLEGDGRGKIGGVLVAIPAFNEADTIGAVVVAARANADAVLVIDDGSEDDTAIEAAEAGAIVVEHEGNKGYGAALQTAFEEAETRLVDHLVTLDGDGQHDPSDVGRLVERQRETGANLVIGSRFADGVRSTIPPYRKFGLGVVNVLTNLSFGVLRADSWVRDTQCGLRAYDREAIRELASTESLGDHMSASTDILYHAHRLGFNVEEVGVVVDYDVDDASTINPLSHGYVLVMNLLNTIERERPLVVLSLPGSFVTLTGFGFGYWGVASYVESGNLEIEIALIALFFILTGFLTVFTGVILHSLNGYFDQLRDFI
ncbi:glycosyltransferase family 2 protein [Halorarum halophilum]|uniref:Glycosyltransferase family 2 protein n=1 Tax=Halorarum halophilum TaxID=2743090 RepID=A0A7D5K9M2_9EURY|nr:glycosyltransferase family 2 protein [Halobaculum halophilum]QLG29214.1 glycosyltransferase family 2 protein [Halobaculum halophilum]